jgi:hypothetical protein
MCHHFKTNILTQCPKEWNFIHEEYVNCKGYVFVHCNHFFWDRDHALNSDCICIRRHWSFRTWSLHQVLPSFAQSYWWWLELVWQGIGHAHSFQLLQSMRRYFWCSSMAHLVVFEFSLHWCDLTPHLFCISERSFSVLWLFDTRWPLCAVLTRILFQLLQGSYSWDLAPPQGTGWKFEFFHCGCIQWVFCCWLGLWLGWRVAGLSVEGNSIWMFFIFDRLDNQSSMSELSSSEQSWDGDCNLHEFFFEFCDHGVRWLAMCWKGAPLSCAPSVF